MQMRVLLLIGVLLVLAIGPVVLSAQDQPQNSASCQVFATILPAYSAVANSPMNFSAFSSGSEGGMLTLAPQGKLSVNGSIEANEEFCNAASYYVIGDNSTVFSVSLPQEPLELVNIENANTLFVGNWESAIASTNNGEKANDGLQTVYVGATLEVESSGSNQRGNYTGLYTITFDFN
jgi:hypothetical protein